MAHIFISYAKKDTRALAEALYHALNDIPGLTAWMDMSLEADSSWAAQIQQEIDRADYLIVLLSPDVNRPATAAQARSFVLNEIDYAQQDRKPILPVMAQQTRMPVQIAGIQYIDLTATPNDPARVVDRVARRFGVAHVPTAQPDQPEARLAGPRRSPLIMSLVIVGVLIAAAAWVLSSLGGEDIPATAVAEVATETPTLSSFQMLQTTEAELTQSAVTQTALQLSLLDEFISTRSATATAALLAATETAAFATLLALSATPTPRPTDTSTPTVTATPTPSHTPTATATDTPDPLQAAFTPVARNADWTPVERDFDGVTMVLVPAGCFMMGSDSGNRNINGDSNESPVHEQCFDHPFWIDKVEVTQGQFRRLGGIQANRPFFTGHDRPVENITWFEARDFCALRAARLPTEREWEYAARGPDALVYPWGNDFVSANAVHAHNSGNQTAPVGSRLLGASWVGALDMSGNVLEWVGSLYQNYPYYESEGREDAGSTANRGLRGGSFRLDQYNLRAADRLWLVPDSGNLNSGFRCARSYE